MGADFEGLDPILGIAIKGVQPKALRGNDYAVARSFQDYNRLIVMARAGV